MRRMLVLGAAALLVAGCSDKADPSSPPSAPVPVGNESYFVVYTIDGSASRAMVTMQTPTGQRQENVALPHSFSFRFDPDGFVYVSAQNQGDYGRVECRIDVDGSTLSRNSSGAAYGIATCQL